MPSVCRIVNTLPISAVSLPFSSSIMNRRPVPDVRASTFCVTPSPLRVLRTSLPMSCGVYFKSLTPFNKVTVREYYSVFWAKSTLCYRTGIFMIPSLRESQNVPVREQSIFLTSPNNKEADDHYSICYSRIANIEWRHELEASRRRGCAEAMRLS